VLTVLALWWIFFNQNTVSTVLPVLVRKQILSAAASTVDYSTGTRTAYLLANQYWCPYCSTALLFWLQQTLFQVLMVIYSDYMLHCRDFFSSSLSHRSDEILHRMHRRGDRLLLNYCGLSRLTTRVGLATRPVCGAAMSL